MERAFHLAFGPYRINPKRELFQIEPKQAIALLEVMTIEDVMPRIQAEAAAVDAESTEDGNRLKAKRQNFNFHEMGIPISATLQFAQGEETVEVSDKRRVRFRGQDSSLIAATRELLGNSYHVAPGLYWRHDGRSLRDIYNETYELP